MIRWSMLAVLALAAHTAYGADASVATYAATYRVIYKGKDAGTAEFNVRYLADQDIYEFRSSVMAKGMLKLARPNPAVERSQFRVDAAGVRPQGFWYEDGSRSGEDNFHIDFDWQRNVATVSNAEARREFAVPEAVQDRGSLQVALMRDLAATGAVKSFKLADEDGVIEYEYAENGTATMPVGKGPAVATRILTQQRVGSSRITSLWVAPSLRFLPVRMEQRRDGEVQTAFELISVTGLSGAQ
ncbi:MAG TPA: DUF3108 domain-containing protein [Gammaproteobacteria bacterium]|nr:DUF3108 domain-containing protein [Gammaproteobacteria bacterium]